MILRGFQDFFHVAALCVSRHNRVDPIRQVYRPIVEQINDDFDARIQCMDVPRLVIVGNSWKTMPPTRTVLTLAL